jgi:hypothetical protein
VAQAMKWTWLAASGYSADRDVSRCGSIFPLRMALFVVSACAKLVILLRAWRLAYYREACSRRHERENPTESQF